MNPELTPNIKFISTLVDTVSNLKRKGIDVVIVTSASIGFGSSRLGFRNKPSGTAEKQAAAAIGQCYLMRLYEDLFHSQGIIVGQILVTRADLLCTSHFKNFQHTLKAMLGLNAVPIVNENDTIAVDELRFGDNDYLSSLVAVSLNATKLFLLTDVDALYDDNPHENALAKPICNVGHAEISELENKIRSSFNNSNGKWGTGGIVTKLIAAKTCQSVGIDVVLMNGNKCGEISQLHNGKHTLSVCTYFHGVLSTPSTITNTRKFILFSPVKGSIVIDIGAVEAISMKSSLFVVGVIRSDGQFLRDDVVEIIDDESETRVGLGVVTLDYVNLNKILRKAKTEYSSILGFDFGPEIIFRESLILS